MRFLADECCDFSAVKALRTAGHDVLSVTERNQRAGDSEVIKIAAREKRILLTEDKDFGQLVYAYGQTIPGVIFLRFPSCARKSIAEDILKLINQQGENLIGCFTTVQPGHIRIAHPPQ